MREAHQDRKAPAVVETVRQDVRFALRTLRKSPSFTITSIAVLALAIGANTAMFSVLNAVLLKPLPYHAPDQLATLWTEVPSQNIREGRTAFPIFEEWQRANTTFSQLAAYDPASVTLTTPTDAEQISAIRTSANLFSLLGVSPQLGRTFTDEEARQGQRLVVISHRFWQLRFGGVQNVIGSSIDLNGIPSRIIGVMPEDFESRGQGLKVWQPYTMSPGWDARGGSGSWFVTGRLKPGVTFEQAQADMGAIARRLDEQMPAGERGRGISVVPMSQQVTAPRVRLAVWMLTGAVFFVLLIAATNVASLSLARSATRGKELAIRAALGASRARIAVQLLIESLTLAALSGILGLAVAYGAIRVILAVQPGNLDRLTDVRLDPQVLAWALGLCLLTGLLVGLAPVVTMVRRSMMATGRGISGHNALRRVLVMAEFALAIVLLAGAGLLMRSLWSVQHVDPGFRPAHVLTVSISSPFQVPVQQAAFQNQVIERVESLPGVESAGIIGNLFFSGNPERTVTVGSTSQKLRFRTEEVSAGFFRAMGTPLVVGRFFTAADGTSAARVAIVNESMARRLWPDREAIGQPFQVGAVSYTLVGVVGDMRRQNLETEPIPQMFEPLAQNPSRLVNLLVRTSAEDPLAMAASVRAAVREVEKHAPVYGMASLESQLGALLAQRRLETWLLMGFASVALLMAAIGIYGLIQYSIAARTQEIGIRMAVGAQAGSIFRMVLGEGLKLSLIGLAVGLVGALWLGAAASSLLFGVSASDPLTFVGVSVLLILVAVFACYFPARRAMKVDPIVALRQE